MKGLNNLIVRVCEMRVQSCQLRNLDCKHLLLEGPKCYFRNLSCKEIEFEGLFLPKPRYLQFEIVAAKSVLVSSREIHQRNRNPSAT